MGTHLGHHGWLQRRINWCQESLGVRLVLPGDTQLLFLANGPRSPRVLAREQVLGLPSSLGGLQGGGQGCRGCLMLRTELSGELGLGSEKAI